MVDTTARHKHACVACGGQAVWTPSKQALVCSYCGTEAPGELNDATGEVQELELARALADLPDALRGWQAERRSVRCRSCHAVSVFEPQRVGQNCDFCGASELVDYEEIKAPIRPLSLLPFKVTATSVRGSIRDWFRGRWFAPSALKRKAMVDTVQGVYVPYWTFDAQVHCPWTALSGTYYYVTRTFSSGGRTRTRRVRKVRWRPAAGTVDHFFDDEPVPGTRGVETDLLGRVQPFPTQELVPYDTGYLSGFVVEHYQVVLFDAAQRARESMHAQLRRLCAREVPGDTHANLNIDPQYSGETFKHILVPLWLLVYRFRGKPFQVVVNGYTGTIAGRYPKSPWKIALLVLAGVSALAALLLLIR